jgi:hypothetical protein
MRAWDIQVNQAASALEQTTAQVCDVSLYRVCIALGRPRQPFKLASSLERLLVWLYAAWDIFHAHAQAAGAFRKKFRGYLVLLAIHGSQRLSIEWFSICSW